MKVFPSLGVTGFEGPGLGLGGTPGPQVFPGQIVPGVGEDPAGEVPPSGAKFVGGIAHDQRELDAAVAELRESDIDDSQVTVHAPGAGGVARALEDLGVPAGEISVYEDRVRHGGGLITVRVDHARDEQAVRRIFGRYEVGEV